MRSCFCVCKNINWHQRATGTVNCYFWTDLEEKSEEFPLERCELYYDVCFSCWSLQYSNTAKGSYEWSFRTHVYRIRLVNEGQEAGEQDITKWPLTTFERDCFRQPSKRKSETQILKKMRHPDASSSYHALPWLIVLFDNNRLLKSMKD